MLVPSESSCKRGCVSKPYRSVVSELTDVQREKTDTLSVF